jgi:hypothetical protein
MQAGEGMKVALIHGQMFVHENFADKLAIIATNNIRIRGAHGPESPCGSGGIIGRNA